MNLKITILSIALGLCAILHVTASTELHATPLSMNYQITGLGGGSYQYDFNLVIDNNDGSWVPGQRWNWLIFGDANSVSSPLTNWAPITPSPLPQWIFTSTAGGHNGPTLIGATLGDATIPAKFWTPTAVGQSLSWSGTASAFLGQDQMLFSTLIVQGGAVPATFKVANFTGVVPEPSTYALLGIGILGMLAFYRKKRA